MSSSRLNFDRKRRSDYETSESGSEEEYAPVRKIRRCRREASFKQSFASRCRNLWQWISDLPLTDYFKDTMYKKSLLYPQASDVVVIDDDDDDDDVIPVEEDDDIAVIYETNDCSPSHSSRRKEPRQGSFLKSISADNIYSFPQKNKSRYKLPEIGSVRRPFNGSDPLSFSTPFIRDNRPIMDVGYNRSSRQHANGFHSSNWDVKDESVAAPLSKLNSKRHISPITNPGVDVQILLSNNGANVEDSDDLEIISEVSKVIKPQHPKVTATYKLNRSVRDGASTSQGAAIDGNSNSECAAENGHSSSASYTAHEVVRLQEKAQYKLLLDKLVNGSVYHPVISRTGSQGAEIQIDLTEDDEDIGCHYKKEVLKQPVADFLKKYYKPCRLLTPPPQDLNSHLQMASEASAKDDVKVVEVKPLPEYRRQRKPRSDFFSPEWIQELKMTINSETEKRLQIVAEQEQKIERYRSRRDAKIAEENRLRDELMNVMLPRVKVEKEEEFPALTSDMNNIIDAAFESGNPGQVLSSINRVDITLNDIATLNGLSWLNDTIINCYLQLIVERSKLDNFPSVYSFNSFFYVSLKTRGGKSVLRWTRKVDIFSYDIVFIPLHLGKGMHWALGVIDNRVKKILYYDSMRNHDNECLLQLQRYIVLEMKDKKKKEIDANFYSIETAKGIPQQMNGSDCGMFTLKYAEYVSRDAPITFTQKNMYYFRRKMVYELLTKQLL